MLIALALIIFLGRWWNRKKSAGRESRFVANALASAQRDRAVFDLRLHDGSGIPGISCELESVSPGALKLKSADFIGDAWDRKPVEAFFHINEPEGPVFFVFNSKITGLAQSASGSSITIAAPAHLRVEKKRHFTRATPDPAQIRMIAVWPVQPGRRLPRSNSDLGRPALAWKNGQTDQSIRIENISGGGLAIKFALPGEGKLPFAAEKGRQLFCLIVYSPQDSGEKTLFWCSGEIMSARTAGYAISLGLEFTNWALQEKDSTEIHWTHSSPWQGAKPILKWVNQLQKPKAGGSIGSGS